MKYLTLALLILMGACASSSTLDYANHEGKRVPVTWLCVVNSSIESYRIRIDRNRVATVYPGEKALVDVQEYAVRGTFPLVAEGITTQENLTTPSINLGNAPLWEWVITESTIMSGMSVNPVDRSSCQ